MTDEELKASWVVVSTPASAGEYHYFWCDELQIMNAYDAARLWQFTHPNHPYQTLGAAFEDFCVVNFAQVITSPADIKLPEPRP